MVLHRAHPRHGLDLGPADLGHLLGLGPAPHLHRAPVRPARRLPRPAPPRHEAGDAAQRGARAADRRPAPVPQRGRRALLRRLVALAAPDGHHHPARPDHRGHDAVHPDARHRRVRAASSPGCWSTASALAWLEERVGHRGLDEALAERRAEAGVAGGVGLMLAFTHAGYVAAGWGIALVVLGRLRAAHGPPGQGARAAGAAGGAPVDLTPGGRRRPRRRRSRAGLRRARSSCSWPSASSCTKALVVGVAVLLQRRRGGGAARRARRQALPPPGHRPRRARSTRPPTASSSPSRSTASRVDVHHDGDPPELFEPGIPVVLEGRWDADRRLSSTATGSS